MSQYRVGLMGLGQIAQGYGSDHQDHPQISDILEGVGESLSKEAVSTMSSRAVVVHVAETYLGRNSRSVVELALSNAGVLQLLG